MMVECSADAEFRAPPIVTIYVDVSAAVHAKAGIGRYAGSLARALSALEPGRFALFYNRTHGSRPPEGLEGLPVCTVPAGYKPWRMAVWLGHLAGLSFNRFVPGAELFHATEHLLPPLPAIPTVLTVHDMIFRLFPQHQKRLNYWYLNATMPLYCRRADALITVSECSKRDIVAHYGIDPAKVTVVYEAAAEEMRPARPDALAAARERFRLPDRYLMHVGTIEPRKNLTRLVGALHRLQQSGTSVPLVVVGSKGWLYEELFRRLEQLSLSGSVHLLGHVAAAELPLLYGAATAAVMPSVYEGFGLPVLEAMACGTPVLCSNASSLPEVGGEAPCFFDPYDEAEIAEAILRVWEDAELREEMKRRGLEQAARFSWTQAARETLAVYDRLLGSGSSRMEGQRLTDASSPSGTWTVDLPIEGCRASRRT